MYIYGKSNQRPQISKTIWPEWEKKNQYTISHPNKVNHIQYFGKRSINYRMMAISSLHYEYYSSDLPDYSSNYVIYIY